MPSLRSAGSHQPLLAALVLFLLPGALLLAGCSASDGSSAPRGASGDVARARDDGADRAIETDADGVEPPGEEAGTADGVPAPESSSVAADGTAASGADSGAGPEQEAARQETDSEPDVPAPRTSYMGREIARTMHWTGADWLIRATREDEEAASVMLDALGVEPGSAVCDFGCGNGYHTLRLARLVGPEGTVYGVDLQEQMLGLLMRRVRRAVENDGLPDVVQPVLAEAHDPRLEPGSCDLVLMVDVYHELGYPERVLAAVRRALRPGGRLVLVEFRAEDPEVPIKRLHKMSKQRIRQELEANGFRRSASFDKLPWQHMETYVAAAGAGNSKD